MNESHGSGAAESREERLAEVLAECSDRLNAGEKLDLNQVITSYPGLSPDLGKALEHLCAIDSGLSIDPVLPEESASEGLDIPKRLGDFEIIRELGRGGMGIVYMAYQSSLGRVVALKVLPFASVLDPRYLQRFKNEAAAAAQLHHPNIVPVYSVGSAQGVNYYAMEFIEGQNLERLIRELRGLTGLGGDPESQGGTPSRIALELASVGSGAEEEGAAKGLPVTTDDLSPSLKPSKNGAANEPVRGLPPGIASRAPLRSKLYFRYMAEITQHAAEALDYAHESGIIHRDVKPSNLLLDHHGKVWVTDFGIARFKKGVPVTGTSDILGTLRYMSPEQALAKHLVVDHRTDIYSLGVTLYELLTLEPPFHGTDREEILNKIVQSEPPRPRKLNAAVPRDLETIALKAMEKSPEARYMTAAELAADLKRFLADVPIHAKPPTILDRTAKWCRRHKHFITAAASLFGVALIAATAWMGWTIREDRELRKAGRFQEKVLDAVREMHMVLVDRRAASWERAHASCSGHFNLQRTIPVEPGDIRVPSANPSLRSLEKVCEKLEDAARILPENPDPDYHLARVHLILGQDEAALKDLDRAIGKRKEFIPARILRASLYQKRGEVENERIERDEAERLVKPEWAQDLVAAYQAMERLQWKAAAEKFRNLRALTAQGVKEPYLGFSIEVLLGEGIASLEAREFSEAQGVLELAMYCWPTAIEPVLLLGKVYLSNGSRAKAEERFDGFYRKAQFPDDFALGVADLYSSLGENDRALEWVDRLKDGPLKKRARTPFLLRNGRCREATDAAKLAIEERGNDSVSHFWLGLSYLYGQGASAECMDEFQAAIRLDEKNPWPYFFLGLLYNLEGKGREGVDAIRKGLQYDPQNSVGYYFLGLLLLSGGDRKEDLEEAVKAFRNAGRLDPRTPDPYLKIAWIRAQQKNWKEAMAAYSQALEANSERALLSPEFYNGFRKGYFVWARDRADIRQELQGILEAVEKALKAGVKAPAALSVLSRAKALLVCLDPNGVTEPSVKNFEVFVDDAKGWRDPDVLAALSEVQFAAGLKADAVLTLEKALRLPQADRLLLVRLDEYRNSVAPDLPSCFTIDAALGGLTEEVLPRDEDEWRFHWKTSDPAPALEWTEPGFDDLPWEPGRGTFSYGHDDIDIDIDTPLKELAGAPVTLYLRRTFKVNDPGRYRQLTLKLQGVGGCVAYLNAKEIGRVNAGEAGSRLTQGSVTPPATPQFWFSVEVPIEPGSLLQENVLAIQGLSHGKRTFDFSLSVKLEGKLSADPERDPAFQVKRQALAAGENSASRMRYLEGRLLQLAGRPAEAALKFSGAVSLDSTLPEPLLRLAECLRAVGRVEEAEERVRKGLEQGLLDRREILDLWLEISFVDLGRSPAQVVALFPNRSTGGLASSSLPQYAGDVLWLLDQLERRVPLRILCGGVEKYVSRKGETWRQDCFYLSGTRLSGDRRSAWSAPYTGEIYGTEDDPIYQTHRAFPGGEVLPPKYRIPLPPGRYRVTLHFAEICFYSPKMRRFSVLIEDKEVLHDYEPYQAGYLTAGKKVFDEKTVSDGFLDIEFIREKQAPKVSAIEVEWLE